MTMQHRWLMGAGALLAVVLVGSVSARADQPKPSTNTNTREQPQPPQGVFPARNVAALKSLSPDLKMKHVMTALNVGTAVGLGTPVVLDVKHMVSDEKTYIILAGVIDPQRNEAYSVQWPVAYRTAAAINFVRLADKRYVIDCAAAGPFEVTGPGLSGTVSPVDDHISIAVPKASAPGPVVVGLVQQAGMNGRLGACEIIPIN